MDFRLPKLVLRFPVFFFLAIVSYEISAIFLVYQLKFLAGFFNLLIFQKVDLRLLESLLAPILIFIFLRMFFVLFGDVFSKKISNGVKGFLRNALINKIVNAGNLLGETSAGLQSLILDDVEAIDAYFSQFLPQIYLSLFVPLTLLAFVFPIDALSASVFIFTAPLIPLFMVLIGSYSNKKNSKQLSVLHKMSAFFLDSIQGIKTIILLNQQEQHLNRIKKVSEDYRHSTMQVLKTTFLSAFTLELLSTISTAIIAVEIGLRLLYGQMTFENAFLILLIAPEFYLPLRNLGARFHAAMSGTSAARNIYHILDVESGSVSIEPVLSHAPKISQHEPIIFKGVNFSYPNGEELLENISLEIARGSRVSIVGATGVGKSTFLQLLMRFVEPSSGNIFLGSTEIRGFTLESWRDQFSWLPQNPVMLNDSIRNNLKMANPQASDTELEAVLRKVDLWELVDSFERKLDTNLIDHGRKLSSGEMQRLSLGRVLLRNRPIILLDEPTSSLDLKSESRVLDLLNELPADITIVSIAHRLNTILQSDQVFFFNEKRVEAIGSHSVLLSSNSNYNAFCEAYFGGK
jgi:ATP-binding cassette subfamily C protein CydD